MAGAVTHALPHAEAGPTKRRRVRKTAPSIPRGTTPTYEWRCGCPDFLFRGAFRSPPSCKHILAVVHTLQGNQTYLTQEGPPTFLNEGGPLGFTPEDEPAELQCRRWWLAPQTSIADRWVVQRTRCPVTATDAAAWMAS